MMIREQSPDRNGAVAQIRCQHRFAIVLPRDSCRPIRDSMIRSILLTLGFTHGVASRLQTIYESPRSGDDMCLAQDVSPGLQGSVQAIESGRTA